MPVFAIAMVEGLACSAIQSTATARLRRSTYY
jgi:hypothetical protein